MTGVIYYHSETPQARPTSQSDLTRQDASLFGHEVLFRVLGRGPGISFRRAAINPMTADANSMVVLEFLFIPFHGRCFLDTTILLLLGKLLLVKILTRVLRRFHLKCRGAAYSGCRRGRCPDASYQLVYFDKEPCHPEKLHHEI